MMGQAGFFPLEGRKERHKGRVWGVYVTPAARGQGVGKAMLIRILARARGYPGLEQVSLSVAVTQETARKLYDALGFQVYGYERRSLKVGDTYVDEEDRAQDTDCQRKGGGIVSAATLREHDGQAVAEHGVWKVASWAPHCELRPRRAASTEANAAAPMPAASCLPCRMETKTRRRRCFDRSGLPAPRGERAEAAKRDGVVSGQRLLDGIEYHVYRLAGLGLGQSGPAGNAFGNVGFVHGGSGQRRGKEHQRRIRPLLDEFDHAAADARACGALRLRDEIVFALVNNDGHAHDGDSVQGQHGGRSSFRSGWRSEGEAIGA